ncbi:MAG: DNA topoisomerase [Clostridia bacterium]|nr:DNA topoisomerase [Clostridia bacterium]
MKKLVIAEKNSVATSIVKALYGNNYIKNSDGFYEAEDYVVAFASGHLVGLCPPDAYDDNYKKWQIETLPIIPKEMKYIPIGKNLLKLLCNQIKRNDINSLVCATDAGREGELIFRLIYIYAKCKKPVERLWLSSMEDEAIREGFRNLKPSYLYDNLYLAAKCRQDADWLVGMNATRLFSIIYGKGTPLKVGRVRTPTLNLINTRDSEINSFQPQKYYHRNIIINGIKFKSEKKYSDYAEAKNLELESSLIADITDIEMKNKALLSPKLFDLTLLQRTANKLLGYTANQTLDIVQSLYEKKLVTYPRTDSNYITHDMSAKIPELVNLIYIKFIPGFTQTESTNIDVSVIVDDKRVTDHHAIIPTVNIVTYSKKLSQEEINILKLISFRLAEALGDRLIQQYTKVSAIFYNDNYSVSKTVIISKGYKEITELLYKSLGLSLPESDEIKIQFQKGKVDVEEFNISEHITKPLEYYTEDTLLKAMEHAGNKDMAEDVERKGLGTSATRASIIEALVNDGYVERKKKKLQITEKGKGVIAVLPEAVKSVQMTVDWENKLSEVSKGHYSADNFICEIKQLISNWVKIYSSITPLPTAPTQSNIEVGVSVGNCPCCGNQVTSKLTARGYVYYGCSKCNFKLYENDFYFAKLGKKLTKEAVQSLLYSGKIRVTGLVSKKTKRKYSAIVKMTVDSNCSTHYEMIYNN